MIEPKITLEELLDAESKFSSYHLNKYRISIQGLQEPGPLSLSNERYDPINVFRQSLNKVTDGNMTAIMTEISDLVVDNPMDMARILFEKVIEEPKRAHIFFSVVLKKESILKKFINLCSQDHKETITINIDKINTLIDGDIEDVDYDSVDSFHNYCRRKINMMRLVSIFYTLGLIKINIINSCRKELYDLLMLVHDEDNKFLNFVSQSEIDNNGWSDEDYYSFVVSCDRLYCGMFCSLISEGMVKIGECTIGKTEISIRNTLCQEEFIKETEKMLENLEGKMEYEHSNYLISELKKTLKTSV